ncbi:MAG: hypothetical protein WBN06_14550 [Lysobacterales bacterium]
MFQIETSAFFCTTAPTSYLTISSESKLYSSGRKADMYFPELRFRIFCTLFMFLFSVPLTAQELDSTNRTQNRNQWGQAEQRAYRLTQNTTGPYHLVAACREYCRELVETRESRNE